MLEMSEWNNLQLESLSKAEVGRYVVCEAKDGNSNRMHIHCFSSIMSKFANRSWWGTFTLSTKSCSKGFYLCLIQEFKLDRKGYINMIVHPCKCLGETINDEAMAWDYFIGNSKNFSSEYAIGFSHYAIYKKPNYSNLEKVFEARFKESEYATLISFLFYELVANGSETLDEVSNALAKPSELDALALDVVDNLDTYAKTYPAFIKKLHKENLFGTLTYTQRKTKHFIEEKDYEYDYLKLGTETLVLKRVEAVCQYWIDFYANKKALEKAARKAAKSKV